MDDALVRELSEVVRAPTGTTTAGHPFLVDEAWTRFRDHVPHILAMGPRALAALDDAVAVVAKDGIDASNAAKVVRGCILTASITAPPDLWLLRHVVGAMTSVGVVARILAGESIDAARCDVAVNGKQRTADPRELDADLTFLVSRGLVDVDARGHFTAPKNARARETLANIGSTPPWPADVSRIWLKQARGESTSTAENTILGEIALSVKPRVDTAQETWIPTADEVQCGYALVPLLLAYRASGMNEFLVRGTLSRSMYKADTIILAASGVLTSDMKSVTEIGKRVAERGAGPMGIIEAYHPYMAHLVDILVEGRANKAWVTRGANIAASQDANKESFTKANDALDGFCQDTGFGYRVFIEHAIGRGEATRQRFARPGGAELAYFGADLEDAAIDACVAEQQAGRLPANMKFVRHADIGEPAALIDAIRANGASTEGAVMIVGNGFHEVRNQSDDKMVNVFKQYCDAGIVLLFTEENALRVDDLLSTAWNTYHAGFRYVHAKSGQGLRPAEPAPPSSLGRSLGKSWRECAEAAGYVRIDKYSSRSRTVYPLAPRSGGLNPTISSNHFCVPRRLLK